MDNNININDDKINNENDINNLDINNSNILKNSENGKNFDLLDKIGNFNIDENEDEDEEEQNDAYIQELVKQGKYSDVIRFLESQDKKIKRKKKVNNDINTKNENENIDDFNDNEDEELVIIPADDISDLHEDNINNNEENNEINEIKDDIKKDIFLENNNINENNANIENVNIIEEKNDIKLEKDNKEENKETNLEIKKEINKSDIINNNIDKEDFIKEKNNNTNNNVMNNKEIKDNVHDKEDIKNINENIDDDKTEDKVSNNTKEIQIKNNINISENNNNNQNNNIEINDNKPKEKDKNNIIAKSDKLKQENINNNIINNIKNEKDIKPKDIIKNIITTNNSNKIRKSQSQNSSSLSLLQLSYEEDEENNKYFEEKLKEIQEQRKVFVEQTLPEQNIAMNNLELLTKELEELNELENNENEDLNGIEQMNEVYIMVQEDKQSSLLQEKVREKLFPFYNKANFDIKDAIKNDYFKSINFTRNFYISSKIIDNKNISKKRNNYNFNISYPKSIFDSLKFDKTDIKNGLDFDEYLDEFLEEEKEKSTKKKSYIKTNPKKIENIFSKYKNKLKIKKENKINNIKPIKIYLNNKKEKINDKNNNKDVNIKDKYEIKIDEIYNKYKDQINSENNDIDLRKYNNFFVDNFNKKNEIFNFNDYSIDLDLDDDIKKELTNKANTNNIEDKDKEKYYLKINNNKLFHENILNNYNLLRFINLENNNLTKFPDFSRCPMIYSINMNNNKITKIDKISTLKYLEKLSLTNNTISHIENCSNNKRLRFLFLGHNQISNIDNISSEVPFIEEVILCQNNISSLPNEIYLPYLKFFDLNENKICIGQGGQNFLHFICPSLEKLLLLGNNLNEEGTQYLIKYCPKLKEIDLSFNKFNDIIELVKILSINSCWNNNLEMINVVGNTFFNSNKNKELFYLLIKRFCPSIKFINNEEIKKNKSNPNKMNNIIPFNNYSNINCNLNESYINIYNNQNSFMKYFTSVYFTNKIFNIYNININNNLKSSNTELFLLINDAYYKFKLSHFISQINISKNNIGFFSYECNLQFNALLTYLYKFKNRMTYITHSIPILVKRTWFRRMKIIKIQQQYKLRILRKKLASIVIPDDEFDHAEDLLEFFNSDTKKDSGVNEEEKMIDINLDLGLDEKMKEIELNIEKNMKNKKSKSKSNFHALEVIKEEDKDIKDIDLQIGTNTNEINNNNKVLNENKININSNHQNINNDIKENKINDKNINNSLKKPSNTRANNNINANNKIEISALNEVNKDKEKDSLVMKLLSNPKYNSGNNKLNPIRLTPIVKNPNNIQSSTNIIGNNSNNYNNNNYNNYQNIDRLKIGLGMAPNGIQSKIMNHYNNDMMKIRYPTKIILKDDKNYGKLYDINAQSNLPKNNPPTPGIISGRKTDKYNSIKRPESNGVFLPKITNNNLNVSTTTLSNETNSVYSNLTTGKKFANAKIYNNNHGRVNSKKKDEILLLQQECREVIEKAKSEWKFTNKDAEAILVNKIQKKYNKKIKDLLHKNMI